MTLAIALVPSNQDRNLWADKSRTERDGMEILCDKLEKSLPKLHYNVKSFYGKPESKDVSHLSGLIAQTKAAAHWLNDQIDKGDEGLALHLHSDAAPHAHAIGIYDSSRPGPNGINFAATLAHNLASVCAGVHPHDLGAAWHTWDYRNYIFSTYGTQRATNILLETFSHGHLPSNEWFMNEGYKLADAIVRMLSQIWPTNVWYCEETGQSVDDAYGFYSFVTGLGWRHVELLGYPIAKQDMDGEMPVQVFERARLEYHANDHHQPVKLTRLGALYYEKGK